MGDGRLACHIEGAPVPDSLDIENHIMTPSAPTDPRTPVASAAASASGNPVKKDLEDLIDALSLDDVQKRYLRGRWLDQLLWMDSKAGQAQKRYYTLQLTTIIGGVVIAPLVSLDASAQGSGKTVAHWLAITIGLIVAISAAVEGFFHFGDRWKQYRRDAELLKAEGWQFSQRSGPYQSATSLAEGYPTFVGRVEQILQKDVESYFTQVVPPKKDPTPETHGT
jgi:Protein of unknown function (DUF4231)